MIDPLFKRGAVIRFADNAAIPACALSPAVLAETLRARFFNQKDAVLAAATAMPEAEMAALDAAMTPFEVDLHGASGAGTREASPGFPLTIASYGLLSHWQRQVHAAIERRRRAVTDVCQSRFFPADVMDKILTSFDTHSPRFSIWI